MHIYVLPLSETGEPIPSGNQRFIKLPRPASDPYILRLVIFSSSEIVNKGVLHCNVPPLGVQFQRSTYYTYPINASFHEETHIDIVISTPGPYSYFITYIPISDPYFAPNFPDLARLPPDDDTAVPSLSKSQSRPSLYKLNEHSSLSPDSTNLMTFLPSHGSDSIASEVTEDDSRSCTQKFYFAVSAGFSIDGEPLSLNSLNIETVVSKWMGPVTTWKEKLTAVKDKGYNMIHFTPLQERGSSNSPYSIFDQLVFDKQCFPNGENDVVKMITFMEHDLHLLSLTDVVYNHTAQNSDWLRYHPEAGYSSKTAPHLNPAIDLDTSLLEFSANLRTLGYPTYLNSVNDIGNIMDGIKKHVITPINLWEYYVINVADVREKTLAVWKQVRDRPETIQPIAVPEYIKGNLPKLAIFTAEIASLDFYKFGHSRYIKSLNPEKFAAILISVLSDDNKEFVEDQLLEKASAILDEINFSFYREYDDDIGAILTQVFNRIKYTRLDTNGPNYGEITPAKPLVESYFTRVQVAADGEVVALANNGWIWSGNPLVDFASAQSKAYLRREVNIWGDCVKLRYGNHPSDSPYLWDRMTKYTQLMAKYFHGFRIDNCHSTPLHVGEYMLDKARLVRDNLYVAAELFTGSEEMDRIFVERFGITSLIREAMQAWSVEDLSRLIHRHGGRPIGSFSEQSAYSFEKTYDALSPRVVRSSNIHALFMDCTHDNETPAQKRTVEDTLPNAALVAMCSCAVGSVMGYDEGYPKLLEIVAETRQYTFGGGISKIKKILYDVHTQMGQDNADEMHVHHEGQYITVHRINPRSGEGWFLIARTKFGAEGDQQRKSAVFLFQLFY